MSSPKRPPRRLTASAMGKMGGLKRMRMLTPESRKELAKLAANARWAKRKQEEIDAGRVAD